MRIIERRFYCNFSGSVDVKPLITNHYREQFFRPASGQRVQRLYDNTPSGIDVAELAVDGHHGQPFIAEPTESCPFKLGSNNELSGFVNKSNLAVNHYTRHAFRKLRRHIKHRPDDYFSRLVDIT